MLKQAKLYFDENSLFYSLVLLFIALNMIFLFAVIVPEREKVGGAKKEYLALRKEKARLIEEQRENRRQLSAIKATEDDIASVISGLPSQSDITGIITDIHGLARKERLTIRSASYTPSKAMGEDLLTHTFSFPLTGTYGQVRRFIYGLENMPYLMSIDDIGITSSKGREVSLSIKVSVYLKAVTG